MGAVPLARSVRRRRSCSVLPAKERASLGSIRLNEAAHLLLSVRCCVPVFLFSLAKRVSSCLASFAGEYRDHEAHEPVPPVQLRGDEARREAHPLRHRGGAHRQRRR